MYSNQHIYREDETAVTSFPHTSGSQRIIGGQKLDTLFAHVHIKAAANTAGSTTVTVDVVHSDDNSTWTVCTSGAAYVLTLSTTAQTKVFSIPFTSDKEYTAVRVNATGGTSPTLKYNAFQALERLV